MQTRQIRILTLFWFTTAALCWAAPSIGPRVIPPSQRGYAVQAIRESGERGGLLLTTGTNFAALYNREMGDAMELWNAHHWQEAVVALGDIWRTHPDSPWAAEAELHEACYMKFNGRFDEAEERFVSILQKYPDNAQIRAKVLHYLPHLYAQTGRMQAALDAHLQMQTLPMTWQERQHFENYARVFSRRLAKDNEDRLCGTKALALALASQNEKGHALRNVSMDGVFKRFAWSQRKATNATGFSLQELAGLSGGTPVALDLDTLQQAATPGRPVLVYLKTPSEPKCFTVLERPKRSLTPSLSHPMGEGDVSPGEGDAELPLTGHFVVVERVGEGYVDLLDPDSGRVRWPLSHFVYRWSGASLKLPGQNAIQGGNISSALAQTMRGGCCGSPPPDPCDDPCCDCNGSGGGGGGGGGGGTTACPSGNCPGGGGGNGGGGGDNSCCECQTDGEGQGSPIYRFGLSSANLQLKDIPMWYPNAKGPRTLVQLIYNRVETERMATNSAANYYPFGNKWFFNFSSYLTETPGGGADIVLPGARVQQFLPDGSDYVAADIWNQNTLVKSNDWFILTFKSSEDKWYYLTSTDYGQRLEKIEDRYGNAITLQYDNASGRLTNIVDAADRFLALKYNAQGFVTNITDSLERVAVFAYSDANDLISMTDMGGYTTTIQYDTNHWPSSIVYPSGGSSAVVFQDYTQLPPPYNSYPNSPFRMVVTDPLGQTNEYFYHAFAGPAYGFDFMGPVTERDKAGNTWMLALKSVGGSSTVLPAQRVYYTAVNGKVNDPTYYNGYGDQWQHTEYDVDGNPEKIAMANEQSPTAIGYYAGEGAWVEDVLTTNLYDARHNLLSRTVLTNNGSVLHLFGAWTNGYDDRDNLLISRNPLDQVTAYAYSDMDELLAITNALLQVTLMRYDQDGNITNLIDALNRTNAWTYDTNGRETEALYADGLRITKGYDSVGRLSAVTNFGSGLVLQYTHDNLDRVQDVIFPDNTSNHFQYACCGLEMAQDRLGRLTFYDHDALSRVSQVTDPLNRITQFRYNGANQITNLITYVGGIQRLKRFDYTSTNGFSRLTQVTTPMGKLTRYDYTFRGGLAWREDGNGNVTKYQYDPLQRLVAVTDDNDNPLVTMDYDVLNNVASVSSANSAFNYLYDRLNRVTNLVCVLTNIPGFATVKYQIGYSFDAVGNVTNRVITGMQGMSGTITTRYQYDVMNRLTNVVQLTNDAVSARAWYAYDAAGRLWQKGYGNNDVVTHGYDSESRLLSLGITNNGSQITRFAYLWDDGGNIQRVRNWDAAGVHASLYSYDAAGQLTNEIMRANGVSLGTNTWQYDEAGNWLNAGPNLKWVYNADNELLGSADESEPAGGVTVTGQVEPGPCNNKWANSTASCRGVQAQVNPSDGTFSLPGVPLYAGPNTLTVTVTDASGNTAQQVRHVTKSVSPTFAYDGNGNLTNWANGDQNWAYEWDWADRLIKVTSNNMVVLQNWYDADGRRIAKQEAGGKWFYLCDGIEIVGAMNENGQLLESYTRSVGLAGDIGTLVAVTHHAGSPVTPETYYTHCNHRGDIVLTRSSSTTVGTYTYSAFGILNSESGPDVCRFKFSSKEQDASTGFSYYGFRFYAPQWQRWPNHDPIGEIGFGKTIVSQSTSALNLYAFVGNSPISKMDFLGLSDCTDKCYKDFQNDMDKIQKDTEKCLAWAYSFCLARKGGYACFFWASVGCGDKAALQEWAAASRLAGCLDGCPSPPSRCHGNYHYWRPPTYRNQPPVVTIPIE